MFALVNSILKILKTRRSTQRVTFFDLSIIINAKKKQKNYSRFEINTRRSTRENSFSFRYNFNYSQVDNIESQYRDCSIRTSSSTSERKYISRFFVNKIYRRSI